jgi:hypothetical protein
MWTEGRTDRRIDMTKLIVAFRNFTNALRTFNVSGFEVGTCDCTVLQDG